MFVRKHSLRGFAPHRGAMFVESSRQCFAPQRGAMFVEARPAPRVRTPAGCNVCRGTPPRRGFAPQRDAMFEEARAVRGFVTFKTRINITPSVHSGTSTNDCLENSTYHSRRSICLGLGRSELTAANPRSKHAS